MKINMSKGKKLLLFSVTFIVGIYFLILGLAEAKSFLAPLVTAAILSMLMVPVAKKLESWKIKRVFSSLLCTLIILIVFSGIFSLLSFQVKNFVDDWDKIQETMKPKIEQLENFVYERTPLSQEDFEKYKEENDLTSLATSSSSGKRAFNFMNSFMSFVSSFLLTMIYIFFLLNYRRRFKVFILKMFNDDKKEEVEEVTNQTAKVAQGYLRGKFALIVILSVLYSIGLGISGVDNFILIAVIASFLTLLPYVGNIIGMGLALTFGFLTQGETSILIGVILTFTLVQFVESYILEPFVVGDQVDLHPFFVILVVVLGNMVWGIIGMVLAIPVLGILNVVFLHIQPLKPFGYLLSKKEE